MTVADISYLNDSRYPRAMRLNNPCLVHKSKLGWTGKLQENKDRSFESFDKYWHGVHAALRIIQKYYFEEKANTIEKLINRYARHGTLLTPYVIAVSNGSGFRPRQVIPWKRESIYLIVSEIARYECKNRNPMIHPDLFAFVWLKI